MLERKKETESRKVKNRNDSDEMFAKTMVNSFFRSTSSKSGQNTEK